MPMNAVYRGPSRLPEVIPVFPLPGALLLPRGQMPLNIFEPRYLAMVDDALRDGHRLIGMIQPDPRIPAREDKPNLYKIGCAGRITQFAETGDGRYLISSPASPASASRRSSTSDAPIASAASTSRRSPTISSRAGRGGGRPRRRCSKALTRFPQGQQSQDRLGRHREAPNEALVNALA